VSDLTTRADDFSFQIMAEGSARFFVRVTSSKANKASMAFSDFILNPDDDGRAVEALHLLKGQGFPLVSAVKLVFKDIHPCYGDESDRTELARRHDQIVSVVNAYAAQAGLTIENTFLDLHEGKSETVVLIE
jgi:hypothetical protein